MKADRLAKLRQALVKKEVDAMFISQPENRFYLSGFHGSAGYLLVMPKETVLATDFRYVEQAKQQAPDFALFEIKGRVAEWFPRLLEGREMHRLGFESTDITFAFYHELAEILDKVRPRLRLVPLENIVELLKNHASAKRSAETLTAEWEILAEKLEEMMGKGI
jgi:Xaa-Pro aminopeptidase